ncbi:MAG: hypothetical protein LBB94_01700 [Clostridiales bacterium]|jgi:hypothetical protein|nr:hypothetical protein [Clostridiales bacterium]
MTRKKKLLTTVTALSLSGLIISGTFAWASLNSSKINSWTGAGEDTSPQYGGTLHDDHVENEENKDVYVENWGQNPIIVRLTLSEYMEIGRGAGVKNNPEINKAVSVDSANTYANIDDPASWTNHAFNNSGLSPGNLDGDIFHEYWQWEMGGQKYYYPAPTDKRGVSDTDGTDYVDSASPENLDPSAAGTLVIKQTLPVEKILTIDEWDLLDPDTQQIGNYWVLDTDGSAYWSAPLMPGEATGLLLNRVVLKKEPSEAYYYGISVQAFMASVDDEVSSPSVAGVRTMRAAANADNYEALLETATEKGKAFIKRIIREANSSDQVLTKAPTSSLLHTPIPVTSSTPTLAPTDRLAPEISTVQTAAPTMTAAETPTPTMAAAETPTVTPTPIIAAAETPTVTPTPILAAAETPTVTPVPTIAAAATPTVTPVPTIAAAPTSTPETVTIRMYQTPEGGTLSYQLTNVISYDIGISAIERGGKITALEPCAVTYSDTEVRNAPAVMFKLNVTQEQFDEFSSKHYSYDQLVSALEAYNIQDFEDPNDTFYWAYLKELGNIRSFAIDKGFYVIGYSLSKTGNIKHLIESEENFYKYLTFKFGYLQVK